MPLGIADTNACHPESAGRKHHDQDERPYAVSGVAPKPDPRHAFYEDQAEQATRGEDHQGCCDVPSRTAHDSDVPQDVVAA